jgi:hypothetical protein
MIFDKGISQLFDQFFFSWDCFECKFRTQNHFCYQCVLKMRSKVGFAMSLKPCFDHLFDQFPGFGNYFQ